MTKHVNKAFGYIFLATGVIGCAAFLGYVFGVDFSHQQAIYYLFGPKGDGSASLAPVFVAFIAGAGAYLVRE